MPARLLRRTATTDRRVVLNAGTMKRLATTAAAVGLLSLLPAAAHASVIELGQTSDGLPPPSCPADCTAIGKVTGFQVSNGTKSHPMRVNREGHIIAFTVRLGTPNGEQRQFFQRLFGTPAKIRLAILRPAKPRGFKLKRVSEEFNVERYLGSTPTFVLSKPLPIGVKYEVAVTTTTWAPILAVKRTNKEGWRSSRNPSRCDDVQEPAAHEAIGSARNYSCLHTTARLDYTATFVPTPKPTSK
jgi:hypothetical protein